MSAPQPGDQIIENIGGRVVMRSYTPNMPDGSTFERHVAGGQRVETWMMHEGAPVLLETRGPSDDQIAFWQNERAERERRDAEMTEGLTLLLANAHRAVARPAPTTPPTPSDTLAR